MSAHILKQAYHKAKTTLQDRYARNGIFAGKSHFSDVWLRDSCYASLGSLSLGDTDIVKTNLTTMLTFMSEQGQIPLRVGQKHMLLKFMGFDANVPEARFTEDKGVSTPTDSNSLFLWVFERYVRVSKDHEFAFECIDKLKLIADWNFTQDINSDFLIEEGHFAGWADSLKKNGTVLYTNVLHFHAMRSVSKLYDLVGQPTQAQHYAHLAECIQENINKKFWNGRYFGDWITLKGEKYDYFSTDGNVLAIILGLATHDQAHSIQRMISEFKMDEGFSTHSNHPKYPLKHIYSLFVPLQMHDYHNGLEWLWIGCADAVSKHSIGLHDEAKALLTRIAHKIVEHDGVYEVYHKGAPVKRFFYKSEQWFAWSSGLFVWACHELGMGG